MIIRPRDPADLPAIEALVERCFPPERRGRTAQRLRGASAPLAGLCFVAVDGAAWVGAVSCHPVVWEGPTGTRHDLVLLGPLVTEPLRRGEGIGLALMARAVAALDQRGLDSMLIGDTPYYGRFGYSAVATTGWRLPGPVEPERLLLRAADPARWAGPARVRASGAARTCGEPSPGPKVLAA